MLYANWSKAELRVRIKELAEEVADSEAAMTDPNNYVNRKCLTTDRRTLKAMQQELKEREKYSR